MKTSEDLRVLYDILEENALLDHLRDLFPEIPTSMGKTTIIGITDHKNVFGTRCVHLEISTDNGTTFQCTIELILDLIKRQASREEK